MTTVFISPEQTSPSEKKFCVSLLPSAFVLGETPLPRAPLFVPGDQAYYWTHRWQLGEMEALREINEGAVHRFASGSAAAAWLLSDEE
jgi:hypothetical protein